MRVVTDTLRDSMIQGQSYRAFGKIEIKKTRVFFNAATRDNSPGSPSATIQTAPVPQDVCYSPTVGGLITAYVDELKVKLAVDGDVTVITPYETTNYMNTYASNKPALIEGYLFYADSDGYFKRAYLNMGNISSKLDDCVDAWSNIASHSYGAAFAFSETEAAFLTIDEGGLRPYFYGYNGSWVESKAPGRFMFPATPIASTDRYKTVYSAAVKLNDDVFIYVSNPETGGIDGIKYDTVTGTWTETFEAVPADLSDFYLTNAALTPTGEIVLAGQFQRDEDELGTGQTVRNLALRSDDGFTFSMDRFTLFSNLGYRFHVAVYGDNFYGSDGNLVVSEEAPAWMIADPTTLVIDEDDLVSLSWTEANGASQAQLSIANNDFAYESEALMAKGNEVVLSLGYSSNETIEWIQYGTYIIDTLVKQTADGSRGLAIAIVSKGLWLSNAITYPLYTELDSRHAIFDDLDELDNMYVAADDAATVGAFTIEFWSASPMTIEGVTGHDPNGSGNKEAFDPSTIVGAHVAGIMSQEIKLANGWGENPIISSEESVVLSIYGWSRATVTGDVNDVIEPVLILEDEEGVETYLRFTDTVNGSLAGELTSTYDQFPLTYYDTADGSVPIVYTFTGVTAGDSVKSIGIIMTAASDAQTCIERIDVTGLSREAPVGNEVWELVEDGLKVPSAGREHIMFSQIPTFDKNFTMDAVFEATGDNVYYGLVGLANDAANYIVARINIPDGLAEIGKVREGTYESLAYASFSPAITTELHFSHKDGYFYFSYWNENELYEPGIVTYEWQYADGRMSMSDDEIRHVGSYGYLGAPFFEIMGYQQSRSRALGFAPGQPASRWNDFPESGRLIIGKDEYEYSSRTAFMTPRGPFQVRNFTNWTDSVYCVPAYAGGWAIEFTWFYYTGKGVDDYNGYLIATDTGDSWITDKVCWQPRRRTSGVYHWVDGDRSRWYSDSLRQYYMGNQTKVYVLPCFDGMKIIDGENTRFHSSGSIATLKTNDSIILKQFAASGGYRDISLESILTSLTAYAGAKADFPGNYEIASYSVSAGMPYEI